MKATLVLEHRFRKDIHGNIYSSSNSVNTLLWERYLAVFENLTVLARIEQVDYKISEDYLVSHNQVTFKGIPYYVGPKEFLKNYFKINRFIRNHIKNDQAYICRLPSIVGNIVITKLRRKKIPYVVELVGDPWDVFAPGSVKIPLSFLHRYRSLITLRKKVKHARGIIYVTEKMLQKRYPPNKRAITTHASNVILRRESISSVPKRLDTDPETLKLISIGSLEQLYKAPDIVLEAIHRLVKNGVKLELVWLGDGVHKNSMVQLAKSLGLEDIVTFKGNVNSKTVAKELDNAHLYIHVSRTEGLPRALIEAMATGLPCIGSRVGGIPELLDENALVNKNCLLELVEKIKYFKENITFLNDQAAKNLKKAWEFEFETLGNRRTQIYKSLLNTEHEKNFNSTIKY